MKELLILRHAKSSWDDSGCVDHARELNDRGRRDAPRMGRLLREHGIVPERIVVSTARRTRETAELLITAMGGEHTPSFEPRLYEGSLASYLAVIAEQPDEPRSILLMGHNPTVEELVEALTGCTERMPTAALARIELPIDRWAELGGRSVRGRLVALWRPRELHQDGAGPT